MKTNKIVISPHPDDAALSMGCYLSNEKHVNIATIYSTSADDNYANSALITNTRLKEDCDFAKSIDAKLHHLNLADTNARKIRWNSFDFTVNSSDLIAISNFVECIVSELDSKKYELFFPIGVGLHPDHVSCFYVAFWLLGEGWYKPVKINFYNDVPYCLDNGPMLRSQQTILRENRRVDIHFNKQLKYSHLSKYSSQISTDYCNDIVFSLDYETIWYLSKHELIRQNGCTVDSLAMKDGIKII